MLNWMFWGMVVGLASIAILALFSAPI